MKNLKLILAFCLFIVLAACSDDDSSSNPNPTPDSGKPIVPLAVGNEWTYTKYSEDAQEEFTVKFINTEIIDTTTCYYMDNTYDIELPEYYYNSSLGLRAREMGSDKFTTYFKSPCTVGDKYIAGASDNNVTVLSVNDTVKVPAGTFVCVKYSFDYEQTIAGFYYHSIINYYVCPGIGIIMKENKESTVKTIAPSIYYSIKLKSYNLK